jgi:hypothetical protein
LGLPLTPQTIAAIARVMCGTEWDDFEREYTIGISRTDDLIEEFFHDMGLDDFQIRGSQVSSVRSELRSLNNDLDDYARMFLTSIIEHLIHPADYRDSPQKLVLTLSYLNDYLRYDGFILQKVGDRMKLLPLTELGTISQILWREATAIGFDTVELELERIRKSIVEDPEDAVTAACAVVESICRSILVELNVEFPKDRTISSLYGAVKRHLKLSPDREDRQAEEDADIRGILGALGSIAGNIGTLRTKTGDAHGREYGHRRVDSRIARLAVNAACTLSLFLLETWQLHYPCQKLVRSKEN